MIFGLRPQVDHAVSQKIQRDQDLRAGVVELMLQFRVRIEGVVHDRDAADFQDREIGRHAGDHVGQKQRYGIPLFDPESGQAGGKTVHHVF